ncbi:MULTISPECIES: ImmA/IrrE family metallo-endopeptidase [unclassified Rhizobium]|uniref:ImmA/IrrE family metallo-endopeptidase n=1 Tax=unclassified Rhizobium TaxID=2613769 RepID=UPI00288AD44F|nr:MULTISPECIES: ImmA/IrrE family metallo-endopeptidase [unclassified Rhizobium]
MQSHQDRLRFDIRPIPNRQTTCNLTVWVDDTVVWPVHGDDRAPLDIQIDDLLAFLTDYWKPLLLRQVFPIDVDVTRPSGLRIAAEKRWEGMQTEAVKGESRAVANFERAHNLAIAFGGISGISHFWLMRAKDSYLVETDKRYWYIEFDEARRALNEAGDWICDRLAKVDASRWSLALEAWRSRNDGDGVALLAWSAGLDRTVAKDLIESGALEAPQNFNDAANDNDELRIAARMAGALPEDQIREIIELAKVFDNHDAPLMEKFSRECRHQINSQTARLAPFAQGEFAARFVRQQLGLDVTAMAEVFEIAKLLGIEVRHERVEPPSLVGLAIWGKKFGPGVFLNEMSTRILRNHENDVAISPGARVTLAHEICHLLLDGDNALSAVEILKARMPAGVEQRAKSFAGEFLLPTSAAAERWYKAERPQDRKGLEELVQLLAEEYGVTRSVAAWKIQHAAQLSNIDLQAILDSVAPQR